MSAVQAHGGDIVGPRVLFVDLDGTVRHGKTELGRFVNGPADVHVFPEAVTRMRAWRDAGGVIYGVTNQAGIALGYFDWDTCGAALEETARQAEGLLTATLVCGHAPDADCYCRKPMPGMLFDAVNDVLARGLGHPRRSRCLMVGDRPEDEQAAAAAGVPFLDAATWRANGQPPA